jgi:hypothetical protein
MTAQCVAVHAIHIVGGDLHRNSAILRVEPEADAKQPERVRDSKLAYRPPYRGRTRNNAAEE